MLRPRGPRSRWALLAKLRTLPRTVRLLVGGQLVFNIGFYLVLPYLAGHLVDDLMLAGWVVGLVLGLRTFSQQGLFFLGGVLCDRFGAKPVIVTGCAVRVVGFVLLGQLGSLPGVLAGAMLTGFAAALFSPAVESLLAHEAGELERRGQVRRADVFAVFTASGELGAVAGPMLGALLLAVDFGIVCAVAAVLFVLIGAAYLRWLPPRPPEYPSAPLLDGWREVLGNRVFLLFALGYSGYLVSYNQLYLALPAELRAATGSEAALGWLFALSSAMVVLGQLPVTRLAGRCLGPARGLTAGFAVMAAAFVAVAGTSALFPKAVLPAVVMVVLLTTGQMLAIPFAKAFVPGLAGERRLGAYFGVLHSVGGLAVLLGSAATGGLLDLAGGPGLALWLPLALVPAACALLLRRLKALSFRPHWR